MKTNTTRKLFQQAFACAFLFMIALQFNGTAQNIYLPDSMFRLKLANLGYGPCMNGDSIDPSCASVSATTTLNLSAGNITSIEGIEAFANLQTLDCSNNLLTDLPVLIDSLHVLNYLDCSTNLLDTLPPLPALLTILYCYNNHLTSLPDMTGIMTLYCYNNQLTALPPLNYPLLFLDCSSNNIQDLPALPNGLSFLACEFNPLDSLPALPNSLSQLYCYHNNLSALPALGDSLSALECSYNMLTSLPALPASLTFLACHDNLLDSLPVLPDSLHNLQCGNNNISRLPFLPVALTELECGNNLIDSLPVLPQTLVSLYCHRNNLTSIPVLPGSVVFLNCVFNQLTELPALPDSLHDFFCGHNPNLSCLPRLNRVVNLDFINTNISCLPNYGTVTSSNPPLNSLPLCDLFNSNGCSAYWNINGQSYFDLNGDCISDTFDTPQQNIHVMLYQNGNLIQQTYTGGEGKYSFDVNGNFGNYEVIADTNSIPFSILCPVNGFYTDSISAADSLFYDNDFSLICKTGFDAGVQSIAADHFRPAHHTTVKIGAGDMSNFFHAHCANGVSGSVVIALSGPIKFISPDSSALSPDTISGDTLLIYSIADFGALHFNSDFNIIAATDTFATIGSQACISVTALPFGDNDSTNNSLTHCFTIIGSFDPNDKEVDPPGDLALNGNKWLTYTIHFQNTGTAAAEHIYIIDTLDANLDLSTFQLLAFSHQPLVQIFENGIARFNFPNINLPDSNSNEPASHGYVQYKIKLKNTVTAGAQVKNTAYIYFDFNSPVATNTIATNIVNILGVNLSLLSENGIKIYPNPTTGEFTLAFQNHFGEKASMKIYNLHGENIFEKNITVSPVVKINRSEINLSKGLYVVEIVSGNFSERKKLIVQ